MSAFETITLHRIDVRVTGTEPLAVPGRAPAAEWMDDAACKGRTPLFFPPTAARPPARAGREAKARRLCNACPVIDQCRTYARENHEYGFWAGESEEQRHLLGYTVSAPIGLRATGTSR